MRKTRRKKKATTKSKPNTFLWAGVGIVTAGAVGYLGWRHYQSRNNVISIEAFAPTESQPSTPALLPARKGDAFPLTKGSRGSRVALLQNSLIQKYGASILPRYGADGIWGSETENALKSKGLPTLIDESTYKNITTGANSSAGAFSAQSLASALVSSILGKNYSSAMQSLKQLRSVGDYSAVNAFFKEKRIYGVRHTLVTALLKYFPTYKPEISKELLRIGLKYNGSQWSLSGLGSVAGNDIITIRPTAIWNGDNLTVEVPANMILGSELQSENGFTQFITKDNKTLYVQTNAISYA